MKSISEFLALDREIPQIKAFSERAEIIEKFVTRINDLRVAGGYMPYPASFIAIRLYRAGYNSNSQLLMLYGSCEDSINFSAIWHLKTGSKKK